MSGMSPHTAPSALAVERALDLHRRAFVFDAHVDTLSEMMERGYHLGNAPESAYVSWEKIEQSGLGAQLFACYVPPELPPDRYAERVDQLIDRFEEEAARFPERFAPCRSAADVDAARRRGAFAGLLSIEGGHAIQDSLELLRHFHARGVRAMTLTWNNTNNWADGCGPMDPSIRQHGGLTDFGRTVVGTMEEIGMAVDISHVAPTTYRDVLAVAAKPPFASHSSLKELSGHRRNLTDGQLRALAERGGVLGVCLYSGFLRDDTAAWEAVQQSPEYAALKENAGLAPYAAKSEAEYALYLERVPNATLDDAVEHVDRALRVMGTEAVALGSDFDGARRFPEGLDHLGLLPNLTAGLLDRGWREEELEGMLGRNLLEYFRRVIG